MERGDKSQDTTPKRDGTPACAESQKGTALWAAGRRSIRDPSNHQPFQPITTQRLPSRGSVQYGVASTVVALVRAVAAFFNIHSSPSSEQLSIENTVSIPTGSKHTPPFYTRIYKPSKSTCQILKINNSFVLYSIYI